MRIEIFDTPQKQEEGLQYRPSIEGDTVFIFPLIAAGSLFHSRNVREPFDLAFISKEGEVLLVRTITPPEETMVAPEGTWMAMESEAGLLFRIGFKPGALVDPLMGEAL
jgi:uncharacterized membrane protein (UPF0127 family)